MTIAQALKRARRIYAYFYCANGAFVTFTMTKKQVREIASPARLDQVYSNDDDSTATWSYDEDAATLHIHFNT